MRDTDKSYLEIKVTFHHILILLAGVILIGSFLFYLGYQAGKSASKKPGQQALLAKGKDNSQIEIINKDDPDRIKEAEEPSIGEEIKLHQQPGKKPYSRKKAEIKATKLLKKESYYAIQVGAFNSHTLAKNYSRKFSRAGYPTSLSQALVKGKIWYRIRVGNYKTRSEARKEKKKLEIMENKKFTVVRSE